jgi:nicotinamidase/pyrazinamidase
MKALLAIDIQNDFCPGGALGVKGGDEVVPEINRFRGKFPLFVLTQDWHPANHASFAANHPGHEPGEVIDLDGLKQILWPVHCVAGSRGAEFHPDLERYGDEPVFHKGTDPRIDSYSAFYDNAHRKSTGLTDFLRDHGVREVFLCGLATDYCVLYSTLDALQEGFKVTVIQDACRAVELSPGDGEKAYQRMWAAGARLVYQP